MDLHITPPSHPLHGQLRLPGDKSITHRALMLAALADGVSEIRDWLDCDDTRATLEILRALGVPIEEKPGFSEKPGFCAVHGVGLHGLRPTSGPLDCRGSGTAMRLLAGLLSGQPFASTLTGNAQLSSRPMRRIVEPLTAMGARVTAADGHAPLTVQGGALRGIAYASPVASAQVKSAILLAGLYAPGPVTVHEPAPSRDHTERMLAARGMDLARRDGAVTLTPHGRDLTALDVDVPGDFSAAAFPLAAALLVPGSEVRLERTGLNPTRTGLLEALGRMGAEITLEDRAETGGEPVGTLRVRATELRGVTIGGAVVPRMIDEFPVLAVLAALAEEETVVRDAAELQVKESDRIATVCEELQKMGAHIQPRDDGFVVEGRPALRGSVVDAHGDHRLAMALAVAALRAGGETVIRGAECIQKSWPGFVAAMNQLGARIEGDT